MDPLEFAAEDVLLLFSGRVLEVFHRSFDRSVRVPGAWLGVLVKAARHDRVTVTVGRSQQPSDPVYSDEGKLSWTDITFDLAAADEPRLHGFFAEVARAGGRE